MNTAVPTSTKLGMQLSIQRAAAAGTTCCVHLRFSAHTAQAVDFMVLLADRSCLPERSSTARSPCSMALRRRRPKLAGDQAWPGAWGLCQYAAGDCCQLVAGGGAAAPAAICCCVMPAHAERSFLSLLTSAGLNASFQHCDLQRLQDSVPNGPRSSHLQGKSAPLRSQDRGACQGGDAVDCAAAQRKAHHRAASAGQAPWRRRGPASPAPPARPPACTWGRAGRRCRTAPGATAPPWHTCACTAQLSAAVLAVARVTCSSRPHTRSVETNMHGRLYFLSRAASCIVSCLNAAHLL